MPKQPPNRGAALKLALRECIDLKHLQAIATALDEAEDRGYTRGMGDGALWDEIERRDKRIARMEEELKECAKYHIDPRDGSDQ